MGCCGSSGGIGVTDTKVRPNDSPNTSQMQQEAGTGVESDPATKNIEEEMALTRFKDRLEARLHELGKESPPMLLVNPVEGDDRQIIIPSVFKCEETLTELMESPLPAESNLLVTYLKSGMHWMWEIMRMLKKGEATADGIPKEMAHIEFFPPSTLKEINGKDIPVLTTHLPMWSIPASYYKDRKIVYVIRNPKDVCVSLYYHFVSMSAANPVGFPPTSFDHFFEMFMKPSTSNMMGNWFDHVADFWDNHRSDPNILCVMFEDMKQDPMKEVRRINEHMETKANNELMQEIVRVTSFSELKQSKESSEKCLEMIFKGTMYRKGIVGDWKEHMSGEQIQRLDEKMEEWQNKRSEPVPLTYELPIIV